MLSKPIPLSHPSLSRKEISAVKQVMKRGWLTSGSETISFEKEFAAYLASHASEQSKQPLKAMTVSSCTAGLHLALLALNIPKNKKVLVSPYTFVSDASAVVHAGLELDFYDIAKNGLYISSADFKKKAAQPECAAVIFAHISGFIPDHYHELLDIARYYKLAIIEDAAHSFPAYTGDGYLGTMGDIAVFSFYANKTITTGEGGMIVSRDDALIKIMTLLRDNGINKNSWQRQNSHSALYDVEVLGFKYNITDIQAAIGRVQLQKASSLQKKRTTLAKEYIRLLKNNEYVVLPEASKQVHAHSWHIFSIQWKHSSISRDQLAQKLAEHGIQSSIHYRPLHTMYYYKKRYNLNDKDFPMAFSRFTSILSLPMFADMKLSDVKKICTVLGEIVENTYND